MLDAETGDQPLTDAEAKCQARAEEYPARRTADARVRELEAEIERLKRGRNGPT